MHHSPAKASRLKKRGEEGDPAADGSSNRDYWNTFYSGHGHHFVPSEPTDFARWASNRIPLGELIWEFGFGTGRDSLWFAGMGYSLRGFDFAPSAVFTATQAARSENSAAEFHLLDLERVSRMESSIHATDHSKVNIYGRFLLHSLTDRARLNLWSIAESVGCEVALFVEFRTEADARMHHAFGDEHYRKYLKVDVVSDEIASHGGSITETVEGIGLATYKDEDPVVARIAARWS